MASSKASGAGEAPAGLLQGVRVLDLTHYLSGPYCTKLLATMGADVVKIERPGAGDPARRIGPFAVPLTSSFEGAAPPEDGMKGESGAWFLYLNTSKKSVTLDLKTGPGKEILLRLARNSDIVVENFAPGTLEGLGLSYSDFRQVNPALVMTSISNYGQTGPYRDRKAAEINLYAAGGLMNITGEPDQEPLKEGPPLAQLCAGQNAFVATMAGLMYAEETGEGQHIDISIAESATNILENALMQYSYSGREFNRAGNRGYGRAAWGIYPCRDGYVGIIAGPEHRWPHVANIMEREELADPRFHSRQGRLVNADEVEALMLPWLLDHDKLEIFKAGQEHGLGFAFVASMSDILEMEQLIARDYFVELDHPVAGPLKYPGPPAAPNLELDGAGNPGKAWVYRRAPLLGEHTRDVLGELGYAGREIDKLRDQNLI
jgi:crotonobetainyl-CoA:carnitine CoA-transferase CaiB-like acyl-CoA transferase